jgi:hypothetical protein
MPSLNWREVGHVTYDNIFQPVTKRTLQGLVVAELWLGGMGGIALGIGQVTSGSPGLSEFGMPLIILTPAAFVAKRGIDGIVAGYKNAAFQLRPSQRRRRVTRTGGDQEQRIALDDNIQPHGQGRPQAEPGQNVAPQAPAQVYMSGAMGGGLDPAIASPLPPQAPAEPLVQAPAAVRLQPSRSLPDVSSLARSSEERSSQQVRSRSTDPPNRPQGRNR